MQPRERFIAALERRPAHGPRAALRAGLLPDDGGLRQGASLPPRAIGQWDQMEEKERQLHRDDMADLYIATAERYEHSAIFLHPNPGTVRRDSAARST